jgi:chromosome segregation ATPase
MKHNELSVVQCSASSVLNDDFVLHEYTIYNPDDSLPTRFNILKDQVSIYEQRAKFELNEREQKMEWQMRAYITENNSKQETLKRELMSLKKQLDLTVKQKQEIQKGLTSLKHEYTDKETIFLNDVSNLKTLKTNWKKSCTRKTKPSNLLK